MIPTPPSQTGKKYIVTVFGSPCHLHTNHCGPQYTFVAEDSQATSYDTEDEAMKEAIRHHVGAPQIKEVV